MNIVIISKSCERNCFAFWAMNSGLSELRRKVRKGTVVPVHAMEYCRGVEV